MDATRRDLLGALGIAGSILALGAARDGRAAEPPASARPVSRAPGSRAPVPLPFDPTKLAGLSERLLVSHHDNNYAGAVKNWNAVQAQIEATTADTPSFVVAGLRDRELTFSNSAVLHELYFANLGGDGKPGGTVHAAIADAFGGFARFEERFRAAGMGLAGGSGWAILDLALHDGTLGIHASANHTQTLALGAPLLVMDMYEHAYALDYGAAAAKYVDAFFANVLWAEVDRRLERALAAWKALRA